MPASYSILVNTCDKFEDCWEPFFKLWSVYWKGCKGKIYLNTEYKDYSHPCIDITTIQGCRKHNFPKDKRATWSQCLLWALDEIDDDIILYMQEDYFLKDYVKNDIVEQYVKLMHEHPDIQCIHLTDQAVATTGEQVFDNLLKVKRHQRYRVSCQAALWRKDELKLLLRKHESAWEFEEFGSKRSAILNHSYLAVDSKWVQLNVFEIIPYVFTGIIQGRWYEEVVPLFNQHNIHIDFNKRGFVGNAPAKPLHKRIKYRIVKTFKQIRTYYDLLQLQYDH